MVRDALELIGSDTEVRALIISALLNWETRNLVEGEDLRSLVIGPVVDALHASIGSIYRTTQDGLKFEIPYDSRISREIVMGESCPSHIWEPQTTKLLLRLALRSRIVIIGGAFIGDHAIPVGRALEELGGVVYCFEVQDHYVKALRGNIELNSLRNVHAMNVGLWSKPTRLTLIGSDSDASAIPSENDSESFEATTIDVFASENSIENVDLIVLDIEGGESHALQGAQRFLEASPDKAPVLVFEIHGDYVDWSQGLRKTPIITYLENHGYQIFGIRDFQANIEIGEVPIEIVELDGMYLEGPSHGFNVIAVKALSLLNELDLVVRRNTSPKLLRHRSSELHQPGC